MFSSNSSLVALSLLLSLFGLSACSKAPSSVSQTIQKSVEVNHTAQSLADWESSEYHPHQITKMWLDAGFSKQQICDGFLAQTDKDLSLFDEEITSGHFDYLPDDCKKKVTEKLGRYWNDVKPLTEVSDLHFRFPEIVQTRDVSNGYFVVNADLPKGEVLLTFDDGPHPQYTDMILKALEEVNAKAIFFHLGRAAHANPDVVRRVGAGGHSVGSHSITHACLPNSRTCERSNGRRLSFAEAKHEIIRGHQLVYEALGWIDPFFRFPFGESSVELKKFLRNNGMAEFFWSVDSEDWKQKTPDQVVSDSMAQLNARGRGVLLFHDIQHRTAMAIPELLKQLYYGGYTPVILRADGTDIRHHNRLVDMKE